MIRLGSEVPRIWTPPLRPLTPKTSLGFEAVEFGVEVLELKLYPWQKWLLIHGLELDPTCTSASSSQPLFRFDTVLVEAARQNGKTEVMKVLALWTIYVDQLGATVIGTSQDLGNARKAWNEAIETAEMVDDLASEIAKIDKTHGSESMRLQSLGQYMIKAASRKGARGFTGDKVLLDELREHLSWEPWAAATKTTLARPRSQVWAFSNAGDIRSIVLRALRLAAMAGAVGVAPGELEEFQGPIDPDAEPEDADEPDDLGPIGIFEWSTVPGASKWDRDGWAQANPAMGHGWMTERKIAAAAKLDPEWIFRTEVMCQWPSGALDGVFPPNAWDGCGDKDSRPAEGARRVFAVSVAPDQSWAAIGAAAERDDLLVHGQVVDYHRGTGWVVERVQQLRKRWGKHGPVILYGRQAGALLTAFEAVGIDVLVMSSADKIAACAQLYESVAGTPEHRDEDGETVPAKPPTFRHMAQTALDEAVVGARWKKTNDGRFWDPAGVDISPLCALTGAQWGLSQVPDDEPLDSFYAEEELGE